MLPKIDKFSDFLCCLSLEVSKCRVVVSVVHKMNKLKRADEKEHLQPKK